MQALHSSEAFVEVDHLNAVRAIFTVPADVSKDTANHAFAVFGFLVKRNERLSLGAFADRIAGAYDQEEPRIREVLHVLRRCASLPVVTHPIRSSPSALMHEIAYGS
ncbi:hypothetical protein [Paraburkholderia sp. J8-2]|uniref:hypothetical protein n=1 Tax=Paraburkholderia sp. J8-2 TaxID=2805440 RepID=UPI002AB76D25|nr:hypothetical protein [Paraburkholderia sp. J8-2]